MYCAKYNSQVARQRIVHKFQLHFTNGFSNFRSMLPCLALGCIPCHMLPNLPEFDGLGQGNGTSMDAAYTRVLLFPLRAAKTISYQGDLRK